MNRPYIICHILRALDGKIAGEFMSTAANRKASEEYSRTSRPLRARPFRVALSIAICVTEAKPSHCR